MNCNKDQCTRYPECSQIFQAMFKTKDDSRRKHRSPLPNSVRSIIEDGINLYKLHKNKHRRMVCMIQSGTYLGLIRGNINLGLNGSMILNGIGKFQASYGQEKDGYQRAYRLEKH